MYFASVAIIAIVFAMVLIFLRSHKNEYALAIVPLAFLPIVQMFVHPLADLLVDYLPFRMVSIEFCIIFIATVVSCILVGFSGSFVKSRRTRILLYFISGGFTLTLGMIFILNALKMTGGM